MASKIYSLIFLSILLAMKPSLSLGKNPALSTLNSIDTCWRKNPIGWNKEESSQNARRDLQEKCTITLEKAWHTMWSPILVMIRLTLRRELLDMELPWCPEKYGSCLREIWTLSLQGHCLSEAIPPLMGEVLQSIFLMQASCSTMYEYTLIWV